MTGWLVVALTGILALFIARYPFVSLPIIGHLYIVAQSRQRLVEFVRDGHRYHNGSWKLRIPFVSEGWVVYDPAILKYVLTRHETFSKGGLFTRCTRDLFGSGILLSAGQTWRDQRAAGLKLITPRSLEYFSDTVIPRNLPVLLGPLDAAASTGEVIDFQTIAMDFSMAVFGEIAFNAGWERVNATFTLPFTRASDAVASRITNPLYRLTEWFGTLGDDLRRLKAASVGLVLEALGKEETKGILIDGLVQAGIAESHLADSCTNYLTAGRDTTAQALTWTLYELLRHPHCFDADLDAVISESLRLHPPIPIEMLENVSNDTHALPDGSIVHPGQQVFWSSWAMGRLEHLWGPDAAEFRPQRWLEMTKKPTAYEMPVFHGGPRSCVGQPLARIELVAALRELKKYRFEPAWVGERVLAEGMTAHMKGGLPIRVRR